MSCVLTTVICGMRCLKSAHLSVLLVTEEGVFHLLPYFLWDHQVFLKKTKRQYPAPGSLCEKQSRLACTCKPRGCLSQTTSCPAFLRQVVPDGDLEWGAYDCALSWEAGGREGSALWPCRVPRQCEDTLAAFSSYSEPCFSKLTGDHEALRDAIFLARKQG